EAQRRSLCRASAVPARRGPRGVRAGLPVVATHPWTVLPAVAAARKRPSSPPKARPETPAWAGVTALNNSCAVAASQTRTTPAGLPAATHLPSALYATLLHGTDHAVCPFSAPRWSSVAASHTATTSSCPAVTRRRPSGRKATAARTLSEVARARGLPSLGSQSFNSPWVSSPFPVEARSRPSGEKARPVTPAA